MSSYPAKLRSSYLSNGTQLHGPPSLPTSIFPQGEPSNTADRSRVPRQTGAYTSTPHHQYIQSSESRTDQSVISAYDASDTFVRQASPSTAHNPPNPVNPACSLRQTSASFSPQELSNDSSRATTSGWDVDIDMFNVSNLGLTHGESNVIPTRLTPSTSPKGSWLSRMSEEKGKAIDRQDDGLGEDTEREVKKRRVENSMREMERDLALVRSRRVLLCSRS